MKEKAIVTKRGKSWIGTLDGVVFTIEDTHDGIIPDGYVPLYEFLQILDPKITKKVSEVCRKEIGYTKVYVYVENSDKFWAYINHKCRTCKRDCKQSSKVDVVSCPQYEEI